MDAQTPAADKPKRAPALGANALKRSDYERGNYFCVVANDVTLDDILRPAFWQHHWNVLNGGQTPRPFARVEVVRQDGTLDVDLRVVRVSPGMVVMRALRTYVDDSNLTKPTPDIEIEAPNLSTPDGYKVQFIPNAGWQVRLGDTIIGSRLPSKGAAAAHARAHDAIANTPGGGMPTTTPPPTPGPEPTPPTP